MKKYLIIIIFWLYFLAWPVVAAEKLAFTVTPPLFKATMVPGQLWQSSVKVVNNNDEAIKVYCRTYDFRSGDSGMAEFIQSPDQIEQNKNSTHLLSKWIEITADPIEIAPQQSVEIPYAIRLPANAEPGGHYAAIMIGTKPPENIKGTGISVSSMIASLIMLRIKGEIKEEGRILEFNSDKNLYQDSQGKFNIKFQNVGNVHLQPKGNIKIYNAFKDEVAVIPFNDNSDYGNVLPDSTRAWEVGWKSKGGLIQMGRYKATLVASYGEESKQTDFRVLYFWVLNFKTLAFIIFPTLALIILAVYLIKLYIRRVVVRTQRQIAENMKALQESAQIEERESQGRKPRKALKP
jgi:hypothetical protein